MLPGSRLDAARRRADHEGRSSGGVASLRKLFSLPVVLSLLFFGGLFALEIGQGLFRLRTLRVDQRNQLCERIERQHAALARDLAALLGEGQQHAAYLAHSPAVLDVLGAEGVAVGERIAALERQLLPYLASFRGVDRVRLLDVEGRERVRCERMGAGVAAIPAALLDPEPDAAVLELAAGRRAGEVVVSRPFVDAQRVEVTESDRQIFHYVVPLATAGGTGLLALTVYAAPIQRALEAFQPVAGVSSCLLEAAGTPFAAAARDELDEGELDVAELLRASPRVEAALLGGTARVDTPDAVVFGQELGTAPAAVLVSAVPERALRESTAALRSEHVRVIVWMVVLTGLTGLASVFFLRASVRAFRLRETEEYLERIRRESEKYRALMRSAADAILLVEPTGERLLESNERARELLEPLGALTGDWLSICATDDDRSALRAGLRRAAEGEGTPVAVPQLLLRRPGEGHVEIDARLIALEYGGERVVQVSLRDLTREREMERQMQTAERLSSLGLLTAGVAHEINNPLEGIGNYLSLLERAKDEERARRYVEQVRFGFERIRDIVGELLRFARPDPQRGTAELGRVVERALALVRYARELKEVRVDVVGLDEPLAVPGDAGRLEQVLLNLLLNAGRATGGSGCVRIEARPDGADWVELEVEDDGPGIPPADLGRIFDPFFSGTGGSGLGLAVSYGIIRAHGGTFSARNVPGSGARFTIRLPRARPPGREKSRADGLHAGGRRLSEEP